MSRYKPRPSHYAGEGKFNKKAYENAVACYEREQKFSPEDYADKILYETSEDFNDNQTDYQNETNEKS